MNARVKEYSEREYQTIVVLEETTTGGTCYVASHPELPGCMSQGDTPEEAIANLTEARELVIEHLLDNNLPVPPPRYLVAKVASLQPEAEGDIRMSKVVTEYTAQPSGLVPA